MKSTLRMPQKQILTFIDVKDSIFVYNEKEAALAQEQQAQIEDIDSKVVSSTKTSSRSRSRSRSRSTRSGSQYTTIQKGQRPSNR